MSAYDQKVWDALNEHWQRRDNRRGIPNWASTALDKTGAATGKAVARIVEAVPDAVSNPLRSAGDAIANKAIGPAVRSATALLELANDWALELNDPKTAEKIARKKGVQIGSFADLRDQELQVCDRLLSLNTLKWRSVGALEGGAMGALALVPFAGIPLSLTADVVVIQVLSSSIASRVAYSYGFDAKDPDEQLFIQRLVRRSFMTQAAKAGPLRDTARAAAAVKDRVNWSAKLRTDHRLLSALENLMKQLGPAGSTVAVKDVAKVLPYIGILIGAGMNSAVIGNVAADAKRYCQTRFLCEKYELPLPPALWTEPLDVTDSRMD